MNIVDQITILCKIYDQAKYFWKSLIFCLYTTPKQNQNDKL